MGNAADRDHPAGRNLVRASTVAVERLPFAYFGTETVMLRYFRLPV
jgi:hypothetical protein